MYKKGNYEKILKFIKDKPKSQIEIWNFLGKKKISLQAISKHLKRGVRLRAIGYLGNKVRKADTKQLLKRKFNRNWATNAHQHYFCTPKSEKLRKRLLRKFPKANRNGINEISRLYQLIEIISNFQEIHLFNEKMIIANAKADGRKYTKKELKKKIINQKKRIKSYYSNRDRNNPYIKFLKMTPLMYWVAFRRVHKKHHANYNKDLDMIETVTKPLFSKIARLDNMKLIMEDSNSVTIIHSVRNSQIKI